MSRRQKRWKRVCGLVLNLFYILQIKIAEYNI